MCLDDFVKLCLVRFVLGIRVFVKLCLVCFVLGLHVFCKAMGGLLCIGSGLFQG